MKLLSEIISKEVLDLFDGEIIGTIKDITFTHNYKKVHNIDLFDNNDEEYNLNPQKIYYLGEDCLVIKNKDGINTCINKINQESNNPINKYIYSIEGKIIGKLNDIEFNNNLETKNFITKDKKIDISNIVNIGEIIIADFNSKKIKCNNLKPKIIIDENKNIVEKKIQILAPKIENLKIDNNKFKINSSPSPQKIISNTNFLLGRQTLKSIYGINNELIIKKGSVINNRNLEMAKKHNKLSELTLYSKLK